MTLSTLDPKTALVIIDLQKGLGAFEPGFNVTLATDVMADRRAATRDHSVRNIFPVLGETGTTAETIELLEKTRD